MIKLKSAYFIAIFLNNLTHLVWDGVGGTARVVDEEGSSWTFHFSIKGSRNDPENPRGVILTTTEVDLDLPDHPLLLKGNLESLKAKLLAG